MNEQFKELYKTTFNLKSLTNKYIEKKKSTGYRSIHFLAENESFNVEIQLRTLLQDVWGGELEHRLNYKRVGGDDQLIQSGFKFIAEELEACEGLISDLRVQRDSMDQAYEISAKIASPSFIFNYEDNCNSEAIFANEIVKNKAIEYREFMGKQNLYLPKKWIVKAKEMHREIIVANSTLEENPDTIYWIKMEGAFLHFCESNLTQAEKNLQ